MDISSFYVQVRDRRNYLLQLIDEQSFNLRNNSGWSIQGLFRHILWNIRAFISQLGGNYHHDMMVRTDEEVTNYYKKEKITEALSDADELTLEYLSHIDENWFHEETTTYYGKKVTHEFQLFSILCHELEHHGQIRSIYANAKQKTAKDLYDIKD